MRLQRLKKYGIGAGGMLLLVMAILLATGWGSAVAAQISSVFVTNDAAHAVPVREQNLDNGNIKVHEEGTANVNVTGGTVNLGSPPLATRHEFGSLEGPAGTGLSNGFTAMRISTLVLSAQEGEAQFLFGVGCSSTSCTDTAFKVRIAANTSVSIPFPERIDASSFGISCIQACIGTWAALGNPIPSN
jgi:hypothetical protein